MTPVSFFVRISKGEDRTEMLDRLSTVGTVHDHPEAAIVIISYLKDLKTFQAIIREWEAEGRVEVLDMGG